MSKSPILFSSDEEDDGSSQEADVLRKFKMMLQGLPPPSAVTMSKLSVTEMLQKYNENESLYGVRYLNLNLSFGANVRNNSTPLVYYLNSSQISEEIANISQMVQTRYIYSETMSSCNIWFDTAVKSNSAKKRLRHRNGFGLSPGSRLSHLARRRQIFSCENLQQLANSDRRRHIEIKKQTALKTRILERNTTVECKKINSFKRALFLSPDDEDTKKGNLSSRVIKRNLFPSSGKGKTMHDNSINVGVSMQLFNQNHTGGSYKNRRRTESRESSGSWPRRALTFTEEDSERNDEANLRSAKVISEVQLSIHHKSKLLWAVSVTLKENNIASNDPQFKTCASALFMICRKNLRKILGSKKQGGTSEKMLHFAREQIGGIFGQLGITKDDNGSEQQSRDVSHVESNSYSVCSSEHSLDNFSRFRETFCILENVNSSCNSESPSSFRTDEAQTNLNEKENIDLTQNSNS